MTPADHSADADPVNLYPLDFLKSDGGNNLLQSAFWGEFKSRAGWTPRGYSWEFRGQEYRFLLLERKFPGGLSMAYVPYGPELPEGLDNPGITRLLSQIGSALRGDLPRGCFMVRFDLAGGTRGEVVPGALYVPLRRAPYRVQPQDTVILPLDADAEALLDGMHKKTRYNIRLAEKKGVEIRQYEGDKALEILPAWYEIYKETGLRDGISLHPESYYRQLIKQAADRPGVNPEISLYMAYHDKQALGGIIVARYGGRSVYMYGASSDLKRELMPNHLVQWQAITDARREGAAEYDFFGIPPADDPEHPMHGLWRFKTGFGGEIRHYLGAWDYPVRPAVYSLYRRAEALRGWLAARKKHRR